MTSKDIMAELKAHGDEKIKNILLKHGVREPMFGVKVEFLKTIQKKVKKDQQLALDLFATGNADAMYLAGLIAEDEKFTKSQLQDWVSRALSQNISEYTVPWVTAGNPSGFELALKWIDDKKEHIAAAGWSTLANWVSIKPDAQLDLGVIKGLMGRVAAGVHAAPNRVKYTMNLFIICVGCYVTPLTKEAIAMAKKIGPVSIDMNGTACKVPNVVEYIGKVEARGSLGKKKKTVKC
jgi:hypothetical protein